MTMTLREIADLVGGRLAGDGDRRVERVGSAGVAGPDAITFITDAAKVGPGPLAPSSPRAWTAPDGT
jgi:UDP-3-O-[3-hydroxymyristoyl] glucosamine N-acyltransferase